MTTPAQQRTGAPFFLSVRRLFSFILTGTERLTYSLSPLVSVRDVVHSHVISGCTYMDVPVPSAVSPPGDTTTVMVVVYVPPWVSAGPPLLAVSTRPSISPEKAQASGGLQVKPSPNCMVNADPSCSTRTVPCCVGVVGHGPSTRTWLKMPCQSPERLMSSSDGAPPPHAVRTRIRRRETDA